MALELNASKRHRLTKLQYQTIHHFFGQGRTRDSQNNVSYCVSLAYLPEIEGSSLAEDTLHFGLGSFRLDLTQKPHAQRISFQSIGRQYASCCVRKAINSCMQH